MVVFSVSLIIVLLIGALVYTYVMLRNEWVMVYRMLILKMYPKDYDRVPNYDNMLYKSL